MSRKLAMPLLGILLWAISLHSGWFTTASILNSHPAYGEQSIYQKSQGNIKSSNGAIQGAPLLTLTEKNLNDSVQIGENVIGRLNRLETSLGWSDVQVKVGTPAHGQLIQNEASGEALEQARAALVAARASQNLINTHCQKYTLNKSHCAKLLTTFQMTSTPLKNICNLINKSCRSDEMNSKFRSIDGSCNNVFNNNEGKSFTPYSRILFPVYLDGIMEPRRSVTKRSLPNARLISSKIIKNVDKFDESLTLAFMEWSQFVSHDLSHTASSKMISSKNPIMCCEKSGFSLAPRYLHPLCMPILIPSNDAFYSKYRTHCMSYVRSLPAVRSDCSFGPLEQMNQATHFLDGSHIYGSSISRSNSLREFSGGRLLTSQKDGKHFLPVVNNAKKLCQTFADNSNCYKSGDERVNMQPHLTAMHTFFSREHNRIAANLEQINSHWTDERLFQESRHILIAQIQHITYNQWLPILIGQANSAKINSESAFEIITDPSVSNEFATAAIKFINSLMTSDLELFDEDRQTNASLRLQDHFNKPVDLPGHLDGLIRGLATQKSQKMDLQFVSDITQQLYRSETHGMDILSLDIQRGRDHGLAPYIDYRNICNLPEVYKFNDLYPHISRENIEILSKIYSDPKDIDLIIGALSERPVEGSLLGATFTCLIQEQLLRTKLADRRFYTFEDGQLTGEQLKEVRKSSLARIFCDNGDQIATMQPDVFSVIRQGNKLVDCSDEETIGKLDLSKWKEDKSWNNY